MTKSNDIYKYTDDILAAVVQLLEADGLRQASNILKIAQFIFEPTDFNNMLHSNPKVCTLLIKIEPKKYSEIGTMREQLAIQISERLSAVMEQYTDDKMQVKIVPLVTKSFDWRDTPGEISRNIRQNIFDIFKASNISWSGELDEVEFLERLFDLKSIPSRDSRFKDAAGDIWQHRVNNPMDWDDNWVFIDNRFNLLDCTHELFLKFICETVNPITRKNHSVSISLINEFNKILLSSGWEIYEESFIAGKTQFKYRKISSAVHRAVNRATSAADALDADSMLKEILRLEAAVETDPSLAIGTAKELIETCCKTILNKLNIEFEKGIKMPKLIKLTAQNLQLVPNATSNKTKGDEIIRILLSNLAALTTGVAELRGLYGTGHGRDGKHIGLETHHARLAFGAAVVFIDFITDTFNKRLTNTNIKAAVIENTN